MLSGGGTDKIVSRKVKGWLIAHPCSAADFLVLEKEQITKLHIRCDVARAHLLEGLIARSSSLTELDLSGSNLQDQGVSAIARGIMQNNSAALRCLKIGAVKMTPESVPDVVEALV